MITLNDKPSLIDFVLVCEKLRQSEREHLEALWGLSYDHEQVAVSCYNLPAPKWVGFVNAYPVMACGFTQQRPGVWDIWGAGTDEAWEQPIAMTRLVRKLIREMFDFGAHRVQHIVLESNKPAQDWYRSIGLRFEGKMRAWGSKGENALMFACTEKP